MDARIEASEEILRTDAIGGDDVFVVGTLIRVRAKHWAVRNGEAVHGSKTDAIVVCFRAFSTAASLSSNSVRDNASATVLSSPFK
jgi:hypothetical protein